jgi:DNA-directed RNA polymerase, mitochondrial
MPSRNLPDVFLNAGITVCCSDDLKRDYLKTALALGRCLRQRGQTALEIGGYATNLLPTLPIFELDGDVLRLALTDADFDLFHDLLAAVIVDNPLIRPLDHRPEPWTGLTRDLKLYDFTARTDLVHFAHPSQCNAARRAKMPTVLAAVNALEANVFSINQPLLTLVKRFPPPQPDKRLLDRTDWYAKRKVSELKAQTAVWLADTTTAETLDRFYVPLYLDWRGRVYGLSSFNYGRADYVRALFLFADGQPLDDEGLRHLKAHVASLANGNTWSKVKRPSDLDFDDRIDWTDQHLAGLCALGASILYGETPDLDGYADPFQFFAAVVELTQAIASFGDDAGFVSRLPIPFDATSSVAQHLCALTRSEAEGRLVNLTPSPDRAPITDHCPITCETFTYTPTEFYDLYQCVVLEVWKEWQHHCVHGITKPSPTALEWPHRDPNLFGALDRDLVKRPVMSFFYGSSAAGFIDGELTGMTAQIADVLEKRHKSSYYADELARLTQQAIKKIMPEACKARDFLRRLVRKEAKKNRALRWNILGLPIINAYYPPIVERYCLPLQDRNRWVNLATGWHTEIDATEAARSVAANFIHSLDAAHLHLVAVACAREGIPLVAVHDSFATTAQHAKRLTEIIAEQFIELHQRDYLEELSYERPPRGPLDITGIKHNRRAFS